MMELAKNYVTNLSKWTEYQEQIGSKVWKAKGQNM